MCPGRGVIRYAPNHNACTLSGAKLLFMTDFPRESSEYLDITDDPLVTDEARLLARVSNQLADLQKTADRFEAAFSEFMPALRQLTQLTRSPAARVARAAGAASGLWHRE